MKPSDVSCLITQRVVHSEPPLIASASSALLIPSLLFPMVAIAAKRCGDDATFLITVLWPLGSEGQAQTPLVIDEAD